ncbi:polyketide synthase [Apiospora marii]|uniref:polyketide synthase n=1 Tax=Apiospora marii TaxID=335849 RepID=UPI00312E6CB3
MNEPIAVIGLDAVFPGEADTAESFYRFVLEGKSARMPVPPARYHAGAYWHPDLERAGAVRNTTGHYLTQDVAAFDAPFFSITAQEAGAMDPQQRGLLEGTYRALENAGIPLGSVKGSQTGVYVGCFSHDYQGLLQKDIDARSKYSGLGTSASILSNRISWWYDLRGPSVTVDTACSSSLVAAHQACQDLRVGETNLAIAAGCNLILSPDQTLELDALGVLSPDGRSYSFDARANGYGRGEGFGVVVLKRLSDAIRHGDTIRAVIRGSGVNQDGRSPGISQPSMAAQVALMRHVYSKAGLDPSLTRFFEAASAIADMFSSHRSKDEPLYIGALKSNIGHLEGAAGIASIIKGVLTLEKGVIPPNTNFEHRNPAILDEWNLDFPTKPCPWPATEGGLRRMSINSFGFGGTNAHMVLDDAEHYLRDHHSPAGLDETRSGTSSQLDHKDSGLASELDSEPEAQMPSPVTKASHTAQAVVSARKECHRLFIWSAHDQAGIARIRKSYRAYAASKAQARLSEEEEQSFLRDLSYTLAARRTHHSWRSYTVAQSIEDLGRYDDDECTIRVRSDPKLALVFTGQGAQWPAMGKELFAYPVFHESLVEADRYLASLGCQWSLTAELLSPAEASNIDDPTYCQPICTALQVALVDLLESWGVVPHAVVGHSSGEIAAAYAAGHLSRPAAWKIAYYRGKFSGQLSNKSGPLQQPKTSMAAVGLDLAQLAHYIDKEYEMLIRDGGIEGRGSDTMAAAPPRFFSSTYGSSDFDLPELQQASYWVKNLVSPVRFHEAAAAMLKEEEADSRFAMSTITDLLEVGPHAALKGPLHSIITDQTSSKERKSATYQSMLGRDQSAQATALQALAALFCHGYDVDLTAARQCLQSTAAAMLTDLPAYPFNHTKRYWSEPRLARNFRFPLAGRHELLGRPLTDDMGPEAPTVWRNWMRVSENPWMLDHKVQGEVLYPAAGMLVMAIEASRQVHGGGSSSKNSLKAIRMKDVSFHLACRISEESKGVEAYFSLTPPRSGGLANRSGWSEFQFLSRDDEQCSEWREHCRGFVQLEYEADPSAVDKGLDEHLFREAIRQEVQKIQQGFGQSYTGRQVYHALRRSGLEYGAAFRAIRQASVARDNTVHALVDNAVPKLLPSMPHQYVQPHMLHPTTLDCLFQASLLPLVLSGPGDPAKRRGPFVPTHLDELWIATSPQHGSYGASGTTTSTTTNETRLDISAVDEQSGEPMIKAVLRAAAQPSQSPIMMTDDQQLKPLAFKVDWKNDPAFMGDREMSLFFQGASQPASTATEGFTSQDLELLCRLYLRQLLLSLEHNPVSVAAPHMNRYLNWARHEVSLLRDDEPSGVSILGLESKFESSPGSHPEASLVAAVGRSLYDIVSGQREALEVVFRDRLADDAYRHGFGADQIYARLCSYLGLLAHKNPGLRILEVGAGTGGTTGPVLESLSSGDGNGGCRFGHYDFTDISPSFFEQAQESFANLAPQGRVSYRVLDIEKSAIDQGFAAGSYDVVVAANVIHATRSIQTTLGHVLPLLKPGGKLLLYEVSDTAAVGPGFCFGIFPGWWLAHEPERSASPLLGLDAWRWHLQSAGFAEQVDSFSWKQCSLIVATKPELPVTPDSMRPVHIVVQDGSDIQRSLAQHLSGWILPRVPSSVSIITSLEARQRRLSLGTCIFAVEWEHPVLCNMTEEQLDTIKYAVSHSDGMAEIISSGAWSDENSFRITGNSVLIPRLREARGVDSHLREVRAATTTGPQHIVMEFLSMHQDRPLALTMGTVGLLETFCFEDDPRADSPLQPDEVEFRAMACGINFKDLALALGKVRGEPFSGLEASGVVMRAGASSTFRVGDKVLGLATRSGGALGGGFQTRVRSRDGLLFKLPDDDGNISWAEAAGIPLVYTTVYGCLCEREPLRGGDSILIHAATGGVGQAAIQVAQSVGAEVFATVGSVEKRNFLESTYGLARDHIFSSRDLTFKSQLLRQTGGRGVDVVLNSLAGESLKASWDCVAPFGRFVELGTGDIAANAQLGMANFARHTRFEAFDLSYLVRQTNPTVRHRTQRMFRGAMELVLGSSFRGVRDKMPVTVFPMSDVQGAFRHMQAAKHIGKLVLEPRDDHVVPIVPRNEKPRHKTASFDADASYVISGGLGGLGKAIARWMVSRGARHLILLSRSGAETDPQRRSFVQSLQAQGVTIAAPACDVSCRDTLQGVIRECLEVKGMPPIKGCVQGSMVLKDNMFSEMSLEEWHAAVKPKVDGSWNLHHVLGPALDFFVLLSSATGVIGLREQSNYAAGTAFQDGLARYRANQGSHAVSLDLPPVADVGFVAERPELLESLRRQGLDLLPLEDLLAVLDYYCSPAERTNLTVSDCNVVLGLALPRELEAEGIVAPRYHQDPLFRHLLQAGSSTTKTQLVGNKQEPRHRAVLTAAASLEEAHEIVLDALVRKLARILSVEAEALDPSRPLHSLGIDSLVSVELRSWLARELGVQMTVLEMTGKASVRQLAESAVARSQYTPKFGGDGVKDTDLKRQDPN